MMTRYYKVAGHVFAVSGKAERIGRRKAGGGQSSTVILLWETKCLNIWRERGQRGVWYYPKTTTKVGSS